MLDRSDSGLLVVIDGIDGAGKTTQARLLVEALTRAGLAVVASREPTQGPWGQKIRATLVSGQRLPFDEELDAFVRDRCEHQEQTILPALAAGRAVVLDRYFYSTIAYQGIRGGQIDEIDSRVRASALQPDIAFVLDIDPKIAAVRIRQRDGAPNAFERLDDQIAIRAIFKRLAQNDDLTELDADRPVDALHLELMRHLVDGPLRRRS